MTIKSINQSKITSKEDKKLTVDAIKLHKALSDLVRVYQFRDRKRICYYDISITQCHAIGALMENSAVTLNKLAALLYLDKSTASRVVDSLESKGYVQRSIDPTDGRAHKLVVTEKGKELHYRIEQDLTNEMKDLLSDYEPDIRQATIGIFSQMARSAKIKFL